MDAVAKDAVVPPRAQFSLRSLLLTMGLFCVLLAPIHWFGGIYAFFLLLSLILIAVSIWTYQRKRPGLMVLFGIFAVIVGFALASTTLALHSFLNLLVCAVCSVKEVRTKTFAIASAAAAFIPFAFVSAFGFAEIRNAAQMRTRYPMQSLVGRLEFERAAASRKTTASGSASDAAISPEIWRDLMEMEGRKPVLGRRVWALYRLHENSYASFVGTQGFGVGRMIRIVPEDAIIDLRNEVRLPLPIRGLPTRAPFESFRQLHLNVEGDFLSLERIGYVRSREQVAGFEAHGFSELGQVLDLPLRPPTDGEGSNRDALENWELRRLELVSLLRHEEPRVYESQKLPQMDQLADVPNRELDEFEASALPKLTSQEDLVIERGEDRIRMLGAVRAGNDCLQCHEGSRGGLLGAFSYELRRFSLPPTGD